MPPHRNKQFKSTFMWLLKIPLILQLLCYSNTSVIQHRPLNWSVCWKMSAQANKISTYVQYRTCGQNKKSVFRHKDTDYPSITVIRWKASWDFYVHVLQTQASTPIFVKSCETINDKLWNHKRRALTLPWQYSNLVPQHSHTYPATHLQLTESSTFLLLPEIETGPKGTGFPRRQGAATPCSWAFASTARYSLGVLQTKVDPLTSSTLSSLFYDFVPISQDKNWCTILAEVWQPTPKIHWTNISQAPHKIPSPALLPIPLFKY